MSAMHQKIHTIAQRVSDGVPYVLAFLVPFFFLPITTDFFEFNKMYLVVLSAIVAMGCWIATSLVHGHIRLTIAPATAPLLLLVGALLASTFMVSTYPLEVFWGIGLSVISLSLLFIGVTSVSQTLQPRLLLLSATAGVLLMTALNVLERFGVGISSILIKYSNIVTTVRPGTFHPAGSVLSGLTLLIPLLVALGIELLNAKTGRDKVLYGVLSALLLAAVGYHVWLMTPAQLGPPNLIPFQASRSIAIDVLKQTKHMLLGYGPTSYTSAFTQLRPVGMNLTPAWNVRFSSARIEPLQIFTTLGLIGFVAWFILLAAFVRSMLPLTPTNRPLVVLLAVILLEFLFIPANLPLLVLLFLAGIGLTVALKQQTTRHVSDLILHLFAIRVVAPSTAAQVEKQQASRAFVGVCCAILAVGMGIAVYFLGRLYIADTIFYRSLLAAGKNEGNTTYNLQAQTIAIAPYVDRYRSSFAVTNFLIASSLASNSQASQEDKANVPQLIQQSIREAKAAVELDQGKVQHWETLATLYRQLIGVAQSSDQWTIAAYVRAIQLDPTNPSLRLDVGGTYLTMQDYDQAIRLFQQAIELKPDWANAYYNLANGYIQKGDKTAAIEALNKTLALLPESSMQERQAVQDQIAQLNKQTKLTTKPTGTQNALDNAGQIRLPEDLGLPVATPSGTTTQ